MRQRQRNLSQVRTRLRVLLAPLAIIAAACGGDDVTINDDGVSAGGVEIDTIEPANGPLPGGQMITITGKGFSQGGTQVAIGDSIVDAAAVISASELQVRTPAGVDPAAVDVVVFTSVGFASRIAGYNYNPLPTVTAVTNDRGPAAGGNSVTVTGTGFQALGAGDNSVEFGPYTAAATVVSDTELTVTAPSSAFQFEIVDVTVTNSNGAGSLAKAYRYFSSGFIAARGQVRQLPAGELHFVSAIDGSSQFIAETRTAAGDALFFTALTFDPATPGLLLGFDRRSASLFSVDVDTGVGTLIGPLGTTTALGGMSFRGGVLYGNRRAPNTRLIAIDKTTGAEIEFNAENVSCCSNSLVTTPNATQTFVSFGANLQEVDVATGVLIPPAILFSGGNIRGLAFLNNELFGFQRTNITRRGGGGGGPDARSVLLKLNLGAQSAQTIGIVPRFCAMAALPE